MLKITTRLFAAGVLAATLASTNLSASACEMCSKEAKTSATKSATTKIASVTKVALKPINKAAKMKSKTVSNAKMAPKMKSGAAKMASIETGAKKTVSAPMCPMCQGAEKKDKT